MSLSDSSILTRCDKVFPDGPYRAAPWRLVKCEVLFVKCRCSVRFLTACRRCNVIPRFVKNCSKASKLFGAGVTRHEERFQRIVLNRIIKEKYCRLHELRHSLHEARQAAWRSMNSKDAEWTFGHSRFMSQRVRIEESKRLQQKFDRLTHDKKNAKVEKSQVTRETSSVQDGKRTHNRVVIEESIEMGAVSERVKDLLALGPKFVPTTRVAKSVRRKAEVGVERLAFGRRWQREAERKQRMEEEGKMDNNEERQAVSNERPITRLDNDFRLKKLATTEKQAPLMLDAEENALKRLKENIMKLYDREERRQKYQTGIQGRQLTKQERKDLSELRHDSNIIVKPSDKSKGFVLMSRNNYVDKVAAMLDNLEDYERCQVKVEELDKRAKGVIKIIEGKLPTALSKAIIPGNSRMSQFYGLPKDHKPGLPLRPVVSTCGSTWSGVSLVLERVLNQLLEFVPAHLSSTEECIAELRSLGRMPENCIVASLDVVSLYSNIPIAESIDAAMELLEMHRQQVDMFNLSLEDMRRLLESVLNSNYFAFGETVYRQRKGLAMGNHLAPPMAIVFMSKLESEALKLCPKKPRMYRRYIDDCIVVWLHGLTQLQKFLTFINSRHPDIRFTIEHTEQNDAHAVNYLDISVSVDHGVINWELFMKPSHSGVHLSFDSALPMEIKTSVAVEHFRRVDKNASTEQGRQRGMIKIEEMLRENHYPEEAICRAKEVSRRRRQKPAKTYGSILKVPFVNDDLARDVRRTVRAYDRDIRVVFQRGRSLRDMLVSSNLDRPECIRAVSQRKKKRGRPHECRACDAGMEDGKCMAKDVVYSMFCTLCDAEYVGETERCVRERFAEHYRQACASTSGTPWGMHYASHHHGQAPLAGKPFGKATILMKESSPVNRRIMEAIFIRERGPSVNNDRGWLLVDNV